jgi:AmmeMemoRadiSam system protein B/AmmeMemoRadiSam system protein A
MTNVTRRTPPARAWLSLAAALFLFSASTCSSPATTRDQARAAAAAAERAPAVAGQFYPEESAKLEGAVKGFLADAVPARAEPPIALVLPHAGYVFSGQIAADGWRQAQGRSYDLIVILGTNHTTPGFSGASVFTGGAFSTPLGSARVDTEAAQQLLAAGGGFIDDPRVHEREHSIEVQVPFAQIALPGVPILPIVVSSEDPLLCIRLGRTLAGVLANRRALIVASSDLSHYPQYAGAIVSDHAVLAAMTRLAPVDLAETADAELRAGLPGLETCACGEGAIMVAMEAAKARGAKRGIVLSSANSGDTAVGDRARVVGYGAVEFTAGEAGADTSALARPPEPPASAVLGPDEQKQLLALARHTLERWFATSTVPLTRASSSATGRRQGAFVTLYAHGELRGCIGHMAEDLPLAQTVEMMTLAAAFEDSRFSPLAESELKDLEIEISALTPLERVSGPEAVEIGRDGVEIRKDGRAAVFLPQVAVEQGWDRNALMTNLCLKAGLPPDAWKSGAEFWTFRAVHFRESQFR